MTEVSLNQESFVLARDILSPGIKQALEAGSSGGADPIHMGFVLLSYAVTMWRGYGLDEAQVKEMARVMIDSISSQVSAPEQ